jgi:hypothetical protein
VAATLSGKFYTKEMVTKDENRKLIEIIWQKANSKRDRFDHSKGQINCLYRSKWRW